MKNISWHIWYFFSIIIASCNSDIKPDVKVNRLVASQHQVQHLIAKGIKQLANNQVCIVNDKFMNADQISVQIGNKTYYGCCAGCVANLKADTAYRLTTDPVTGERVDKADAIIILMPNSKEQVIYFKSENNARTYVENQGKK